MMKQELTGFMMPTTQAHCFFTSAAGFLARLMPVPGKFRMLIRRDSFSILRANMRWRVGLVLGVLVMVLMIALATLNTQLGLDDTAQLAWIVLIISGISVVGLLVSPRDQGGTVFFTAVAILLVFVPAFGLYHGRPMQHWAYIFPPLLVS